MKANELMIGDWVLSGGKSMKVIRLTDKINMIDDNKTKWFAEEVHPIPLTAEILEKNGFPLDVEETHHPLYKGTEIKEYIISMPPNEYKEHLIWNGEYYIMFDSPKLRIDYVHQFQHALKLCGIDKEIE